MRSFLRIIFWFFSLCGVTFAQSDVDAFLGRYQDIWSNDTGQSYENTVWDTWEPALLITTSDTADTVDNIEIEVDEVTTGSLLQDDPLGQDIDVVRNEWGDQQEVLEWLYLRPVQYDITDGTLEVIWRDAPDGYVYTLPLEHTHVEVHIAWFVSRTTVTHTFTNPYATPIEASYMFPLWSDGAVDHMEMTIWNRTIIWSIKQKEKALEIYEQAKQEWKIASLLDQNRPNVFTQRVANILPWAKIEITISYFEPVRYDDGEYSYVFPMVVWPKFIPWGVTDGAEVTSPQISPHLTPYDITLKVNLDTWTPVVDLMSETHEIDIQKESETQLDITFAHDEIPNKDFVLTYVLSDDAPKVWTIFHKEPQDEKWFVALTIDPQLEPKPEEVLAKEIVFVLDSSGSMMWNPIQWVKDLMTQTIQWLTEKDSFNIIDFNSGAEALFPDAVPVKKITKDMWQQYVDELTAWWGTNMHVAFDLALEQSDGTNWKARIVVIMTDGDVWNEEQVLNLITDKLWNNKVFVFWVDLASNTYLLDKIAEVGKWKSIYAYSSETLDDKVQEFYESFRYPLLTDIEVDWGEARVDNVLPTIIPDLYAGQPLRLVGQFEQPGESLIKITWKQWPFDFSQDLVLQFPEENKNDALKSFRWREKIDELYMERRFEISEEYREWKTTEEREASTDTFEEAITELWLNYHILTEFTSFVAVDETIVNTWEVLEVEVPIYGVDGKDMQGTWPIAKSSKTKVYDASYAQDESVATVVWWRPNFTLPAFLPQTWAELPNSKMSMSRYISYIVLGLLSVLLLISTYVIIE